MKTKRWIVNSNNIEKIEEAKQLVIKGEVVAFPTETVYGLGADATNEHAIQKIFSAKGRPADNPLILHVATTGQLEKLVKMIPSYVYDLIEHFSPGPITYVLESNGTVAPSVTGGLTTIGVRIPNHPTALELLKTCHFPLAAPSANVSGKPSPTSATHVIEDLEGIIAGVIDGGDAYGGIESTVVDCTKKIPTILRLGAITPDDIQKVVGNVKVMSDDISNGPKSPGLKYKHYAPEVPLVLFVEQSE